jgi:hypothetical protein
VSREMKNGTRVRILADSREGFVVATGLDGLTIHLDEGRITRALAKDVTVISTPAPEPATAPAPTPAPVINTHGLSIMRNGEWQ